MAGSDRQRQRSERLGTYLLESLDGVVAIDEDLWLNDGDKARFLSA